LKRLAPLQNGGTSAKNIATICRAYVEYKGNRDDFLSQFVYKPEKIARMEEEYA
jgi:hypothetical protein